LNRRFLVSIANCNYFLDIANGRVIIKGRDGFTVANQEQA